MRAAPKVVGEGFGARETKLLEEVAKTIPIIS